MVQVMMQGVSASADNGNPMRTFARQPKRRLDSVSASLYSEGEQQMMSTVRAVPPSESCSTRVSLESLQGVEEGASHNCHWPQAGQGAC